MDALAQVQTDHEDHTMTDRLLTDADLESIRVQAVRDEYEDAHIILMLLSHDRALKALLADPGAVRINLLMGKIARPDDLIFMHDSNGPYANLKAERDALLNNTPENWRGELAMAIEDTAIKGQKIAAPQSDNARLVAQRDIDIGILLANIRAMEEATGEPPDDPLVGQIREEHEARQAAAKPGDGE